MAMRIPESVQKLLVEQGLAPDGCTEVELFLPASGPMVLRYKVYVTGEHLEKFAFVFQALASESKDIQDTVK